MKPFLFVFLSSESTKEVVRDKYGKECLRTVWECGDGNFALLSRNDCGRLVKNDQTVLKACGCGSSTIQGSYAYFPDTPRNRSLLTKHGVVYHPCENFSEASVLQR